MITVDTPFGWSFCSSYLEEIAERLNRAIKLGLNGFKAYGREIYVSDYESQLEPPECDFFIFGDKYHYTQK